MPSNKDKKPPRKEPARRAVIYVRVSSREQVDGYSLPAQSEACARLINDEKWTLADEFCDSGESARTQDRPQFQAMLQTLADDSSISVLVVHKLDRLARNLEDHVAVRANLRKLGVQLVSVTESLEESASGRLVEGIMASISEFYSANLAQEVKKGMTEKARRGGWPTTAPVGYKNIRLNGSEGRRGEAVIVPDDDQAPLVQQAFELYATGDWALSSLHREITHRGLRSRRGKRKEMSRSKFAEMLHNRAYIGKVKWDGTEYDGTHEPLISEDLFIRVQDVFRIHDRAGERRRHNPHYLKGTLYCESCGSRMSTMKPKGRYTYFYCLGGHSHRTDCDEPYARAEELETQIQDLYKRIRLPQPVADTLREDLESEIEARQASRIRSEELLQRRRDRLESERAKVLAAYYAEAVSSKQLKGEQQRIDTEVGRVHQQLAATNKELGRATQLVGSALKLSKNLHRAYVRARPQVRRQYNQALLGRIYVRKGKVFDTRQPDRQTEPGEMAGHRNDKTYGSAG